LSPSYHGRLPCVREVVMQRIHYRERCGSSAKFPEIPGSSAKSGEVRRSPAKSGEVRGRCFCLPWRAGGYGHLPFRWQRSFSLRQLVSGCRKVWGRSGYAREGFWFLMNFLHKRASPGRFVCIRNGFRGFGTLRKFSELRRSPASFPERYGRFWMVLGGFGGFLFEPAECGTLRQVPRAFGALGSRAGGSFAFYLFAASVGASGNSRRTFPTLDSPEQNPDLSCFQDGQDDPGAPFSVSCHILRKMADRYTVIC
jgi:hypothetical protein